MQKSGKRLTQFLNNLQFFNEAEYHLKNCVDRGWCYPTRPSLKTRLNMVTSIDVKFIFDSAC